MGRLWQSILLFLKCVNSNDESSANPAKNNTKMSENFEHNLESNKNQSIDDKMADDKSLSENQEDSSKNEKSSDSQTNQSETEMMETDEPAKSYSSEEKKDETLDASDKVDETGSRSCSPAEESEVTSNEPTTDKTSESNEEQKKEEKDSTFT